MDIAIKKTSDTGSALKIAEEAKDYFDGFNILKKDFKTDLLYGAFLGNEMVGFITYKEINEDIIEISWLAVLPTYRDKGIGTKLVLETLKLFKDKYKTCEVKTLAETHKDKGYEKTRNFYKKLGFVSREIIDHYPGWREHSPCQIFVKFIK
ncbi:MAG: N-acetyltransferase [bacterium]|nr:N-acetyltransferase [bacterium]